MSTENSAGNEHGGADHGHPLVRVESLKTNEEAKFHVPWETTLAEVWAEAYTKLEEERHPEDELQCADGTKLAPHLERTLEQLRTEKICVNRHFQIRGPTGGA